MTETPFRFSTQLELFPWSGEMRWLPDEILFSFASRQHVLGGHDRAWMTCMQLFGHRQRGSAHDLPSHIDEFVCRTRGDLGSAETVIRQHTVLPFYLPFRDRSTADMAIAAMCGDRIEGLKYQLGILTSRFRAHHPLKACTRCMANDRLQFQVPYWHLHHQYPGVWICPDHEVELLESAVKSTGVGRFLWHLPHESTLVTASRKDYAGRFPEEQRMPLLLLARAAIALSKLPDGFFFDSPTLLKTYHAGLSKKRLCATNGRLRLNDIGLQYNQFVSPFRAIPELCSLPVTERQASSQVSRLFYPHRTGTHPLRHLLIILWLFECWETFLEIYLFFAGKTSIEADLFSSLSNTSKKDTTQDSKRSSFLELVTRQGKTISNAAHTIGIDPATGMAWAAQFGIKTRRRAKFLKCSKLPNLVSALRKGTDKSTAAARHHVSVSTVNRILRTEIGLHHAWRSARLESARRISRQRWLQAVERCGLRGLKVARKIEPAAYAWLHRNDRKWLHSLSGKTRVDTVGPKACRALR